MRTPRNIAVLTAEDDPGPVHRQRSVTAADAGSTLRVTVMGANTVSSQPRVSSATLVVD
jgi:hypothetical protein